MLRETMGIAIAMIVATWIAFPASAADIQTRAEWEVFKQTYMMSDGRIVDRENDGVSHTEGQGYAMLLAVHMNDEQAFRQAWYWTQTKLTRAEDSLHAWRYSPGDAIPVSDWNNATDGDLAIAWALMLAAEMWNEPSFAEQSRRMRRDIRNKLVRHVGGYTFLAPAVYGFQHPEGHIVNLSYAILPAFQDFHRIEPDAGWDRLIRDHDRLLLAATQDGKTLPPDWLLVRRDGSLAPAENWPDRFGFEAVRVPLFLAWAGSDAGLLKRLAQAWCGTGQAPTSVPAWVDLDSGATSPYPASHGVRNIWKLARSEYVGGAAAHPESYYSAVLSLMANVAEDQRRHRVARPIEWNAPMQQVAVYPGTQQASVYASAF